MTHIVARIARGMCVGFLAAAAMSEIGVWAWAVFAIWVAATLTVDFSQPRSRVA